MKIFAIKWHCDQEKKKKKKKKRKRRTVRVKLGRDKPGQLPLLAGAVACG